MSWWIKIVNGLPEGVIEADEEDLPQTDTTPDVVMLIGPFATEEAAELELETEG